MSKCLFVKDNQLNFYYSYIDCKTFLSLIHVTNLFYSFFLEDTDNKLFFRNECRRTFNAASRDSLIIIHIFTKNK